MEVGSLLRGKYPERRDCLDALTVAGSIASIAGFVFAVYVYIKSKGKEK